MYNDDHHDDVNHDEHYDDGYDVIDGEYGHLLKSDDVLIIEIHSMLDVVFSSSSPFA